MIRDIFTVLAGSSNHNTEVTSCFLVALPSLSPLPPPSLLASRSNLCVRWSVTSPWTSAFPSLFPLASFATGSPPSLLSPTPCPPVTPGARHLLRRLDNTLENIHS